MSADDDALGRLLLERGLLAADEYEEAERERKASGRPLGEILVEKAFLSAPQVRDAQAALEKRVRFCPECKGPVYVTRMMSEGERCPRCLGPVEWHAEKAVAQIQDLETIIQLTKDELPSDVQRARTMPGRLFGKYVLVEELGKGGAGVVQKAWDTMLGEYVALKFIRELRPGDAGSDTKKLRQEQILDLLQEARAALRLRHEHIVAVRDLGRIDQQYYIAMDYVEGRTLAEHIRSSHARSRISSLYEDPRFYLGALRDVANAIHYAHTFPKPIVHCDLKPGNIMISKGGTAFVMDFGLARVLGGRKDEDEEEKVRGTPSYMAPEQLGGRHEEIGPRTDVYALGAILYELLAGRPVFTGEPLSILLQATRGMPERPTDIVRKKDTGSDSTKMLLKLSKLEEICLKCLAREAKERYASARAVAEELETVLEAIEAGQDRDMVPPRVLEAQERSEVRRVDEHMTRLDLDQALRETETLERRRDASYVKDRLADRRRQVEILRALRERLVAKLNALRPVFESFEADGAVVKTLEVLKATPARLYVLAGESSRELAWSALSCPQVVAMAERLQLQAPEDRFALGILCHHGRSHSLALRYLSSLAGTPFDLEARRVLQSSS